MALPNSNITTTLVRNTTGVPSNAVTRIVSLAKTGGTDGVAFGADGFQYAGAEPYWNKWAYYIPAVWVLHSNQVRLQKKFDVAGTYKHMLGDFRQYNHQAHSPELVVAEEVVAVSGTLNFPLQVGLYEWRVPEQMTNLKVKVIIGPYTQVVNPAVSDINWLSQLIPDYVVEFTGLTGAYTSGEVKLYASDSNSSELADITSLVTGLNAVPFTIVHTTSSASLGRSVGYDVLNDVTFSPAPKIVDPPGTSDIVLAAGTTAISATIRVTADSNSVAAFTFDLYLMQTNQTDLLVGSYTGYTEVGGKVNDYYVQVTLNGAAQGGDNLLFEMRNMAAL